MKTVVVERHINGKLHTEYLSEKQNLKISEGLLEYGQNGELNKVCGYYKEGVFIPHKIDGPSWTVTDLESDLFYANFYVDGIKYKIEDMPTTKAAKMLLKLKYSGYERFDVTYMKYIFNISSISNII